MAIDSYNAHCQWKADESEVDGRYAEDEHKDGEGESDT